MAATSIESVAALPPWTVEGHRNPKAWYMAMHERGPVSLDERSGVWMFVGRDAVRKFLSQPTLWSTAKRNESVDESLRVIRLLTSDPPIHGKLRDYFARAYRPDRIAQIEQRVRTVCEDLAQNCVAKGTFDAAEDYVKSLAIITICELIGIPKEGLEAIDPIRKMSFYLGALVPAAENPSVRDLLNSGGAIADHVAAVGYYFQDLVKERRANRQDDLVSDLTNIQPEELGGKIDIPALLLEQFGAGTNTTVHVFISLLHELYMQPDLHKRVREDRTLIAPIIDETLRLHAPLQARPRVLTRDTEINGQLVREGAWALAWLGAANVDPAVFFDPLTFNIDRPGTGHIAFGWHEHFCLGTHLARMELRVALDVWLDTIGDFEPLSGKDVHWTQDFILHGADHFPVRKISSLT